MIQQTLQMLDNRCGVFKFMFPNAVDDPPLASQAPVDCACSLPIVGHFLRPKFFVCMGNFLAPSTAMPKAAIDKHHQAFSPESEVRPSQ
jgi:hypothetical protein